MPGKIRCGIAINPIISLGSWYSFDITPFPHYHYEEVWARMGRQKLPDHVESPHHELNDEQGPLLVVYRNPPRVGIPTPLGSGRQIRWLLNELDDAELPYQTVITDSINKPARQLERDRMTATRTIEFLKKNLPVSLPEAASQ